MKIILSVSFLVCTITSLSAQEMKPEETEKWEPVPPVVDPGKEIPSPPSDAIILFDRNDLSKWESTKGGKAEWVVNSDAFTVKPGTGNIQTREKFADIQLHIEWKTPLDTAGKHGQGRGNSGVYLQGLYEVQVLDSYKNRTYSNGQAGSIYKQYIPMVNAMKPPGEWQVYDIIFYAPRFNEDGSLKKPGFITVFHNGVLIHHYAEIKGTTTNIGQPKYRPHTLKMPLMLQDHGNYVSYRNIWLRELKPLE